MERLVVRGRKLRTFFLYDEALGRVHGFIKCAAGFCCGNGEDSVGHAIAEGSGDVVADHETVLRVWQPAKLHGAGEFDRSVPG